VLRATVVSSFWRPLHQGELRATDHLKAESGAPFKHLTKVGRYASVELSEEPLVVRVELASKVVDP
jgi:hypothetical protein